MMWTPYQIGIIIHHDTTHSEFPRRDAPAYSGEIERLTDLGILHRNDDGWLTTTEKGRALVSMWRATPIPVVKWSDPRFSEGAEE